MLTVDLNAFVAGTGSRFDADGEHIFPQQGEVRVREPYGNGWSVVDANGWGFASNLSSKPEAEFVARCLNALRGITPVPGTEEGEEISRQRKARAEVAAAERRLERLREGLKPANTFTKGAR